MKSSGSPFPRPARAGRAGSTHSRAKSEPSASQRARATSYQGNTSGVGSPSPDEASAPKTYRPDFAATIQRPSSSSRPGERRSREGRAEVRVSGRVVMR